MSDKLRAIAAAVNAIEKQFGKGAIMPFGGTPDVSVPVIRTGSIGLDLALGVGGLPRGRVVEVFGPESSGKTTLALHAIAECQKAGGVAAFIDTDHALDTNYARRIGVDLTNLLISQPDCGEQALEIADQLARTGAIDLIVVDSVAALTPRAEIEGEAGDAHLGLQARLMSQSLRKITAVVAKQNVTVVFINTLRTAPTSNAFGPETTTCGSALKFYASVRIDVRKAGRLMEGEAAVGNRIRVKVVKNKVAPPFREAEFEVRFGEGINTAGELVDIGVAAGFVEKSGAWYQIDGERIGQGRERACEWLRAHPEAADALRAKIVKKQGGIDGIQA